MKLAIPSKQQLRAQAHKLKPVVLLGNKGLTTAVDQEIDRALHDHELIKLRINAESRPARQLIIKTICEKQRATLIQSIGHTITIYRKRMEKA